MGLKDVTDAGFNAQVIQAPGLVLADFWAPWCGPCKALLPVLEEVDGHFPDLAVVKINVDDNPLSAHAAGVRGLPSLVLFRNGQMIASRTGAASKSELLNWIQDSLALS